MDTKYIMNVLSVRGNGSIYLGIVGAVRTGKSTFIKRVIETLVVPNITDEYEKKRCLDEIPQSSNGKQIMTMEPKFVPSNGAIIKIDDFETNIKLVDSVGYVINGAIGATDMEGKSRLINTPWYPEAIPFNEAASLGTNKVIRDHATIGIVITTDGSITDFNREDYLEAEKEAINELIGIDKPFIVIINTTDINSKNAINTKKYIDETYNINSKLVNIANMDKNDINDILRSAIDEFNITNIKINVPEWVDVLPKKHYIKEHYLEKIRESFMEVRKIKDVTNILDYYKDSKIINNSYISSLDPGTGIIEINLDSSETLYKETLESVTNSSLSKASLLKMLSNYDAINEEYTNIKNTINMAKSCGYGILAPTIKDMELDTPEVFKQGSRFGIKLGAKASSIHMIRVDVDSSFEPIIGSESQSKELINHIMENYKNDKTSIWNSMIFGRSLDNIVSESIQAKLAFMPENVKYKISSSLSKIVNKGTDKIITIVL